MSKYIKTVNDILALVLLVLVIPGLWIFDGVQLLQLDGEILGASIMAWGLVLQYYFRRKPPEVTGGS